MSADTPTAGSPSSPSSRRTWWAAASGVVAGLLGLLPWLVHGARLPLQNLWAQQVAPEQMPRTMLPFSQYSLSTLAALLVVGPALVGLLARTRRTRASAAQLVAATAGVVLVQTVAVVQSATTVRDGLQSSEIASAYLTALTLGAVGAAVLGVVVLLVVARAPAPVAALGLTGSALALGSWVSQLTLGGVEIGQVPDGATTLIAAIPAVATAGVLAWLGLHTPARVVGALACVALLWVGTALIVAVSAAAGSRVIAGDTAAMLEQGVGVFRAAVAPSQLNLALIGVAACGALLGVTVRVLRS